MAASRGLSATVIDGAVSNPLTRENP